MKTVIHGAMVILYQVLVDSAKILESIQKSINNKVKLMFTVFRLIDNISFKAGYI